MVTIEKIKTIVEMYKKDKVTDYVLERELSEFFGDLVEVKLEKEKGIGKESYCVFAIPEKRQEGFKIVFVIDVNAIKNIYKEDEFAVVCERLQDKIQKILTKYHAFKNETAGKDITLNCALGFLLNLYLSYRNELAIGSAEYLTDEVDVMKYADIFSLENGNSEDLENAKIKGIISNTILEYCKKYVKLADVMRFTTSTFGEPEKPVFCMGQQEMIKHVTSTFGVRDHKEIPYDYLPKTNQ